MNWLMLIREKSPGVFTAMPAGLQQLSVEAPSRSAALGMASKLMQEMAGRGELASVFVPTLIDQPQQTWGVDPNDPLQLEYEAELDRYRREDRERTVREIDELERREAEQLKAG